MSTHEMQATIEAIAISGKGILAADESSGTIAKRFQSINLENTETNRQRYRELLFTTKNLGQYISGVILFDETIKQKAIDGTPFTQVLKQQGIVPGIKVDMGLVHLGNSRDEKVTQGLDGLAERLTEYKKLGAQFAKWRGVYSVSPKNPSSIAISANAECLARYAALCQEQGIVPIVEPEVLMDGIHDLMRSEIVHEEVLEEVFNALYRHHIKFEYMILKPSMVITGSESLEKTSIEKVAEATLRVLRNHVPASVPTINFLSGGQSDEEATAHLQAINKLPVSKPWLLSFSYGRALQAACLKVWQGKDENKQAAQEMLLKRSKLNAAASKGDYSASMEK